MEVVRAEPRELLLLPRGQGGGAAQLVHRDVDHVHRLPVHRPRRDRDRPGAGLRDGEVGVHPQVVAILTVADRIGDRGELERRRRALLHLERLRVLVRRLERARRDRVPRHARRDAGSEHLRRARRRAGAAAVSVGRLALVAGRPVEERDEVIRGLHVAGARRLHAEAAPRAHALLAAGQRALGPGGERIRDPPVRGAKRRLEARARPRLVPAIQVAAGRQRVGRAGRTHDRETGARGDRREHVAKTRPTHMTPPCRARASSADARAHSNFQNYRRAGARAIRFPHASAHVSVRFETAMASIGKSSARSGKFPSHSMRISAHATHSSGISSRNSARSRRPSSTGASRSSASLRASARAGGAAPTSFLRAEAPARR